MVFDELKKQLMDMSPVRRKDVSPTTDVEMGRVTSSSSSQSESPTKGYENKSCSSLNVEENGISDDLIKAVELKDLDACDNAIAKSNKNIIKDTIIKHLLLHCAIKNHDPKILKKLLDSVKDEAEIPLDVLKAENGSKQTALHFAIRVRNISCCNILINEGKGEILAIADEDGNAALHYIAEENLYPVFPSAIAMLKTENKMNLLKTGNKRNENVLHVAASSGSDEIITEVAKYNFSFTAKANNGLAPLHYAAKNGYSKCIEVILEFISEDKLDICLNSKTKAGKTAMMFSAEKGFYYCCKLLESSDINIQDKQGWTALHFAARKGSRSIVKFLLDRSANCTLLTKYNKTALMFAVSNDNEDCVSLILNDSKFISECYKPFETLKTAVFNKSYRSVPLLLEKSEFREIMNQSDCSGNSPLHNALSIRSYEIALALIKSGAQVRTPNDNLEYPIHLAAHFPKFEENQRIDGIKPDYEAIIDNLMKFNRQLGSEVTKHGENCLHICAKSGNAYLLKYLLNRENNVNKNNSRGQTALQVAVAEFQTEIVELLIACMKKNDSNKVLREIHKAAIVAIEVDNLTALKIIIEAYSTDIVIVPDVFEKFPSEIAFLHKKYDIFAYILGILKKADIPANVSDKYALSLHRCCKESLKSGIRSVIEAVIESDWVVCAFDSYYCSNVRHFDHPFEPCKSMILLMQEYPKLACKLLDKLIIVNEDDEFHDFHLFEYIYFLKPNQQLLTDENSTEKNGKGRTLSDESVFESANVPLVQAGEDIKTKKRVYSSSKKSTDSGNFIIGKRLLDKSSYDQFNYDLKVLSPFDENFKLKDNAEEFRECWWGQDHPLMVAAKKDYGNILEHRLTKSWLKFKMRKYTQYLLGLNALCDILLVVMTSLFYVSMRVEHSADGYCKSTLSEICYFYENNVNGSCLVHFLNGSTADSEMKPNESYIEDTISWNVNKNVALQSVVFLMAISYISVLYFFRKQIRFAFANYISTTCKIRLMGIFFMVIPICGPECHVSCAFYLNARTTIQWKIGSVTILVCWLNFVMTLNRIPRLQAFVPFTRKNLTPLLKGIFYIVINIYAFSFIFREVLIYDPSFQDPFHSFVKTITWTMGDLSYDSTFLDRKPLYPILANILFVVFVTAVAGFVIHIFASNSNAIEDNVISSNKTLNSDSLKVIIETQFYFDELFPSLRRKFAYSKINKYSRFMSKFSNSK